jgi:hypothetical protein
MVRVKCPSCGEDVEFQSKAGECCMRTFYHDNVPIAVALDIDGDVKQCECGYDVTARCFERKLVQVVGT